MSDQTATAAPEPPQPPAEEVKIKIVDVDGGVDGAPPWIATFVDMISLLVTFFILLYTFSSIKENDEFTFPKNIVGTAGIKDEVPKPDITAPNDDVMQSYDLARGARVPHARPTDFLLDNMEEMGQKLTDEHIEFSAADVKDGLRIRFGERAGFAPGSARVNGVLAKALAEMGDTMQYYRYTLVIEGYTDDAFKPTPQFPTPESLGMARARAAAESMLANSGMTPELIQLAGFGPPPASNADTAIDRRGDRRVEVRILAMDRSRAKALEEAR